MNKYEVIFEDYKGKKHSIGFAKDVGESFKLENCFAIQRDYLKEKRPKFKSYYIRVNGPDKNGNFMVDFGSYDEFFYFNLVNEKEEGN